MLKSPHRFDYYVFIIYLKYKNHIFVIEKISLLETAMLYVVNDSDVLYQFNF